MVGKNNTQKNKIKQERERERMIVMWLEHAVAFILLVPTNLHTMTRAAFTSMPPALFYYYTTITLALCIPPPHSCASIFDIYKFIDKWVDSLEGIFGHQILFHVYVTYISKLCRRGKDRKREKIKKKNNKKIKKQYVKIYPLQKILHIYNCDL
jgi:hypothetical protein